ncbi:MAG: hypothetical protein LQ339_002676 [Xanthoria mediterranea]|nr:MAG: hypothetical protein LQ339_002676 [Xanthoria mediterranea]
MHVTRKDIDELNSPLLNLPAELRVKIWTYVLGDRLIFINSTKVFGSPQSAVSDSGERPKFRQRAEHRLRRTWGRVFRMVEPSAVNTFGKYRSLKQYLRGYTKAVEIYVTNDGSLRRGSAIDLNILRASRQIYEEAFHIFWTTNGFVFHRVTTFRKFTGSLSVAQRHTLARVYIRASIDPRPDQAHPWERELGDHLATKLPALEGLVIHLRLTTLPKRHLTNSWRSLWIGSLLIDLNEFHTSSTIGALSCLQAVPGSSVMFLLGCDHGMTRFRFPDRLFDEPTSPYNGLIRPNEDRTDFIGLDDADSLCDREAVTALEVFYKAFVLHHPDVDAVKAQYRRDIEAEVPVTSATEEDKNEGEE